MTAPTGDETAELLDHQERAMRRRAALATAGPWLLSPNASIITWDAQPKSRGPVMIVGRGVLPDGVTETVVIPDEVDAEFIAHARDDVPFLLREVEHLRERDRWLREEALAARDALAAAEARGYQRCKDDALLAIRSQRFDWGIAYHQGLDRASTAVRSLSPEGEKTP